MTPITQFLQQARVTPHATALSQGMEQYSYQWLERRSRQFAYQLYCLGLESGQVVAVELDRSPDSVGMLLSIWRLGGVVVPIASDLPEALRQDYIKISKASLVLSAKSLTVGEEGEPPLELPDPSAAAYIQFTSGTTGKPKGVVVPHASLHHFVEWQLRTFAVCAEDRVAQLTTPSFDVYFRDVLLPLYAGARAVFPPEDMALIGSAVFDWLEADAVSVVHTVPSLLRSWLRVIPGENTLRNLRWLFLAGEALHDDLVDLFRSRFPCAGNIVNLYGPTETTQAKFWYQVPEAVSTGLLPVGTPLPGTESKVLGPDDEECLAGQQGEVVIRTSACSLGYLTDPELPELNAAFTFDSDLSGSGAYRTGDLGYIDDKGLLFITGRKDQQVKINGVRVELNGITRILREHPQVDDALVIARRRGNGGLQLVAYVVAVEGVVEISFDELRIHLGNRVPVSMIPGIFVELDTIPLTVRGKVDRQALPQARRSARFVGQVVPPVPRWSDGAIRFIEAFLKARVRPRVLEFGMGGSTLWLHQIGCRLLSVEHDPNWFKTVQRSLKQEDVDLRLLPLPLNQICETLPDDGFDMVIVDHEDFDHGNMRVECVRMSRRLICPGGVLVLDNSDRAKFARAFDIMNDWPVSTETQGESKPGYNAGSATSWWTRP